VTLLDALNEIGYHTVEFLLTPLQYGIPNSRLRYYLLARTMPFSVSSTRDGVPWRHITNENEEENDPADLVDVAPIKTFLDKELAPEETAGIPG
jgi:tRNA (cytosine38-C5)-methyltransferase